MEAMESYAQVESLQQTIYQGEGNTILLIDKLEEKVNQSEQVLNRLFLEEILGKLEGEERELIYQRYFQEKNIECDCKRDGNFTGTGLADGKENSEKNTGGSIEDSF